MTAKPFVKWAGGKRKLLHHILPLFPKSFGTYHEPMVGGGAVFFELQPSAAILNDYNTDLINTYRVVQQKPEALIKALKKMKNSPEDYNRERAQSRKSEVLRAAQFIYLNKLSFNGLYRVNSQGMFNVPYCKDETREVLDSSTILEASRALQGVQLLSGDYIEAMRLVKSGDLVFLDPPYDDTFSSYTSAGFNKTDQSCLKEVVDYLTELGAYAVVCNSDTPFIRKLYRNYTKLSIQDRYVISAKGTSRQPKMTFFITNFDF